MIVPEKPLWGGNKKVCMDVCTTMNVDHKNSAFFLKKLTVALKEFLHASLICLGETVGAS